MINNQFFINYFAKNICIYREFVLSLHRNSNILKTKYINENVLRKY
jgi:hypothetical protein